MKEDILPVHIPPLPSPYPIGEESEEDMKNRIEIFFDFCEWAKVENDKRIEKALKVSGRCSFLKGFCNPFAINAEEYFNSHFSWCPHPYWHQRYTFVDTSKAYSDFENWKRKNQEIKNGERKHRKV